MGTKSIRPTKAPNKIPFVVFVILTDYTKVPTSRTGYVKFRFKKCLLADVDLIHTTTPAYAKATNDASTLLVDVVLVVGFGVVFFLRPDIITLPHFYADLLCSNVLQSQSLADTIQKYFKLKLLLIRI